jgi:hypothetical protein
MIKLEQSGDYRLIHTKGQVQILILDKHQTFAWVYAEDIGEILVSSHTPHKADHVLSVGPYRIYRAEDEPNLTDTLHLELMVGGGTWQGYLLVTGLPNEEKKRSRIIPTHELISRS